MSDKAITLEEFTAIVQQAGLCISSDDVAVLFGEIAASCQVVREMTDRIRARLSPTTEPAHIFVSVPADDRR